MKRGVLTFVVMFVLAVSGIATAGVLAGANDDKDAKAERAGRRRPRRADRAVPQGRIV